VLASVEGAALESPSLMALASALPPDPPVAVVPDGPPVPVAEPLETEPVAPEPVVAAPVAAEVPVPVDVLAPDPEGVPFEGVPMPVPADVPGDAIELLLPFPLFDPVAGTIFGF
jgi:hypothetical protein